MAAPWNFWMGSLRRVMTVAVSCRQITTAAVARLRAMRVLMGGS